MGMIREDVKENALYLQKAQVRCYTCENSEAAHIFRLGSYSLKYFSKGILV
jgi:hypothetical protein